MNLESSRLKRNGAEGERWGPLDHELEINPVIRKLQEVDCLKLPFEFTSEVRGIFSANPEQDDRAGVSQQLRDARRVRSGTDGPPLPSISMS